MKSTYNVEFAGNQIESKEVIAKAKKVWVDAGNKDRKVKDLKTMDDLLPLSELEQKHNFQCYCSNRIYNDDFMPMLIEK